METIGDRIRATRKAKELTQEALAAIVGVGKSSVCQWENGTTKNLIGPNLTNAAIALDVTEKWLLTGKGQKHRTKSSSEAEKAIEKVISMATISINEHMPDMSRDDRIKAISLCLMHYSLNTAISDEDLQKMIEKVLPL